MQDDVIMAGDIKSRFRAIANRAVPPDYIPRPPIEFAIGLVGALLLFVLAFVVGNRESLLPPVGLGLLIGFIGYGVSRMAFGRRMFFARQRFDPVRMVAISLVLLIPICAIFFPEFLRKLYDAIWFLMAIGTLAAAQAVEGFVRREWES